jgi:hypothetical protein
MIDKPLLGLNLTAVETHERIRENLGALIVSTIAAVWTAPGAWLLTGLIGAKLFRDEETYGIPMAFGVLVALVASRGFCPVFRK